MSDVRFTAKMHGTDDVVRLLRRFPQKIRRTLESLVKQEARGLAVELARHTRPFGFGEKAKQQGEKGVSGNIRKVFALPSDAYEQMKQTNPEEADRFWAQVTNRRFSKARDTLAKSSSSWNDLTVGRLDPNLHKQSRNEKGRVTRKRPAMVVTSPKALDTYITRIQKRVGFAKGSWINAAKAIGGRVRGAAQWATRHKQAPGTARVKTGDNPGVTLVNNLSYIRQVCLDSSIDRALGFAAIRLRKALATSLRIITNRENSRMNRRAG